jgi:hypothetical protein
MSIFSRIGATIVIFALTSYSIGIISEQRKKIITQKIILFMSLGVILDLTATVFMIIGSSKGMITIHGFLGYSSFLCMLIDTILLWRLRLNNGYNSPVSNGLHLFSRIAYSWWVIAFITGGLLVALR